MWASPGVGGGEEPADGQVGQSGRHGAGLTLSVRLGLWELPPGRHVLDHPRLRGSVLLWLRQRVPLHVFQVSPGPPPSVTQALAAERGSGRGCAWGAATCGFLACSRRALFFVTLSNNITVKTFK